MDSGFVERTAAGSKTSANYLWSRTTLSTRRLTMAQALIQFLARQYVERDGVEHRFIAGVFGIFGHGNVAGVGQALDQYSDDFRFVLSRNEQAQVHSAAAFA